MKNNSLNTFPSQPDASARSASAVFLARSRTAIDWSPLIVSNPAGSCQACGLPAWATDNLYKIPNLQGRYCSIPCVECALFGPGRCRWCGKNLDGRADRRFCDESCARRSASARFGDGTRLRNYILRAFPSLCLGLAVRRCAHCSAPLAGKRCDSEYCDDRCRKRANRGSLRETPNPRNIADNGSTETTAYKRLRSGMNQGTPISSFRMPIPDRTARLPLLIGHPIAGRIADEANIKKTAWPTTCGASGAENRMAGL